MSHSKPKVIVIGLDGATFTLLKPWMEAGHLPYLKSLMDQGVHGPLQSSVPPVTSPAWQCFMTGKNPGKHGVVWFLEERPVNGQQVLVSATTCEGKTLWELLSEEGKEVAVLNVPFTFPFAGLNGIMIGGFDTLPSRKGDFTHPPGLLQEIENTFGEYQVKLGSSPLFLIGKDYSFAVEAFLKGCEELTDYQFRVAQYVLDRDEFDFIMFYQFPPDRIQHRLWHLLDVTHPRHDMELTHRLSDRILGYYRHLDAQINRLVDKVGPESTVIVMSDHGFGPMTKELDLSSWLLKKGYTKIRKHPVSQLKYLLWKMGWGPKTLHWILLKLFLKITRSRFVQKRILGTLSQKFESKIWTRVQPRDIAAPLRRAMNRLFLSAHDIDWSRTKVYCQTGPGLIRLNLVGREPLGSVQPEEYTTLRGEIVARLRRLVDPTTGQPVRGQVFVREEIYQGKYTERMPDIVFVSQGECVVTSRVAFATSRIVFTDDLGPTGFHRMDGILLAKGSALRRGTIIEGATIMDLAPTILYMMGSKIPTDMDGRVLIEALEEDYVKEHPIVYTEAAGDAEKKALEVSPEDQEAVLERLKGLGYID